jgi:predicted RNA binding protein YcfA (HicA-like mRNA interferase family)
MPKPIKRRELIRRRRFAGLAGPEPGGSHEVMRLPDGRKVAIPNPHKGDLDWSLVSRLIRRLDITPQEWEKLGRR